MHNQNDVITLRELEKALDDMRLYPTREGYARTAQQVFDHGLKHRQTPSEVASNDDLTVTQKELRDALERLGPGMNVILYPGSFTTAAQTATAIVNSARNLRTETSRTASPEERITRTQLQKALEIAGYSTDIGYAIRNDGIYRKLTASEATDKVWAVRSEPVYVTGDLVKDANGLLYKRSGQGWQRFGEVTLYNHSYPVRPLKKVTTT
jgi:hypothetical protein